MIDEYFEAIETAVSVCIINSISSREYVENTISDNIENIRQIIDIRKELLCPSDYQNLSGYLEIGYFTEFNSDERIALFSFMFDIGSVLKVKLLKARFQRYDTNQPIFSDDIDFFGCIRKDSDGNPDLELIDSKFLKNIQGSEVFSRNGFFYTIDPLLNQSLYPLCEKSFESSPIFVRLDPAIRYQSQPLLQLNEDVLIPANPNWWKNLNIHRRNKEGSSYILHSKELKECSHQEFREYRINGIRRLDVVAKRNNKGNLSMMIEELSDKECDSGITIGRCIHLDTDDEIGTPFHSSIVNHLDLAINVYEGQAAKCRYADNLATGMKIEDASFRTHLFRIENIPLKSIFIFVAIFFQSKILINDWFKDQFFRSEES
ncbi:MAG: hypothetical protein ACKN9T_05305 [Candidatus Methylumidiphilus sp.]